jgi:hypothetical protein
MSRLSLQHTQPRAVQSTGVPVTTGRFSASVLSLRSVALSLLVDRALSA